MKDKRSLIIEAAFRVFSEKGYYNAKIEEIAEEAGIGKGTVYSYFNNKQELFDTMVFWFLEEYFQKLELNIDESDDIETMISKFIRNHVNIVVKTKASFVNIISDFANIPRDKEQMVCFHKKFIYETVERYTRLFERAKSKGELRDISPNLAAIFLLDALKGISESIIIFDQIRDENEIAREVTDLLCYGIAKRGLDV